jgi:hypothetical protein
VSSSLVTTFGFVFVTVVVVRAFQYPMLPLLLLYSEVVFPDLILMVETAFPYRGFKPKRRMNDGWWKLPL